MKTFLLIRHCWPLWILLLGCSKEKSTVSVAKPEVFAIGSVLENPRTLQYNYQALVDATVGRVSRKAYEKYKHNLEGYIDARRSDARGKVFEATAAYEANQLYKKIGDGDRVLTTAAEGAPSHPADNLLWRAGMIIGRYQLKSTRNSKSIVKFLTAPEYITRYANEIIVTHPNTYLEVLRKLQQQIARGALTPRWKLVEEAIKQKRLSNYIFPGHEVSSFHEAQKKAEQVIRRQFESARREYGG